MLLVLVGCQEKSEFQIVVDKIDKNVINDYALLETFNEQKITWYLNDELINNEIPYFYTTEDVEYSLKGVLEDGSEAKTNITIKKTNFVTDFVVKTNDKAAINSKDDYVKGKVSLTNSAYFDFSERTMKIKGRGNSTWQYDKKPYKIKFDDRISILGMKNAKEYVLLAEHNDKSLMRNYVAHYMSTFLKIGYTLDTRYVNLIINDEYKGLYLLTEQVEVDKNKLNLELNEKADSGFLIELERDYTRVLGEGTEGEDWFRLNNPGTSLRNNGDQEVYYVIKDPDTEDYSKEEVKAKISYYKKYFTEFQESVINNKYEEFIDVDSFIDYFVLTELMKQVDIGYSSVYINKDTNGKMRMGPIWDFDISSGNGNYYAYGPKGFWNDYNPWFDILISNTKFQKAFIKRFNEVMNLYFDKVMSEIDRVNNHILNSALRNFNYWSMFGLDEGKFDPNPTEMKNILSYNGQVKYLKDYLRTRKEWLVTNLNDKGYFGYLDRKDEGFDVIDK